MLQTSIFKILIIRIDASYDVNDQMQVYGGVNNVTDAKPALGLQAYPNQPLGRFFFVGAKLKLAKLF